MKKTIAMALMAALVASGCVPVPARTTTLVFEAHGENAFSGSGASCGNVAYSYYAYRLDNPRAPYSRWRAEKERIEVRVLPEDGTLKVIFSA
ncbi:hypothetical protein [Tropicimonas sp. S265A]|uniref:hypothetical protein n=1 Tax=Tropicimonas sp. S265A TaxID=3415134 RepID=UPI003C79B747